MSVYSAAAATSCYPTENGISVLARPRLGASTTGTTISASTAAGIAQAVKRPTNGKRRISKRANAIAMLDGRHGIRRQPDIMFKQFARKSICAITRSCTSEASVGIVRF